MAKARDAAGDVDRKPQTRERDSQLGDSHAVYPGRAGQLETDALAPDREAQGDPRLVLRRCPRACPLFAPRAGRAACRARDG
jgi:hypothetical protein